MSNAEIALTCFTVWLFFFIPCLVAWANARYVMTDFERIAILIFTIAWPVSLAVLVSKKIGELIGRKLAKESP